jgi:hypothetical protein
MLDDTAAARILEELDEAVRKSHRSSALRRMLDGMGSAFARLWSRMAPECHRRSPTCRQNGSPGSSCRQFSRRCGLPAFAGPAALTLRPIAPRSLFTLWKDGFRSRRPFFGVECLT